MKYTILILALVAACFASATPLTMEQYTAKYDPITFGFEQVTEEVIREMYNDFLITFKNVHPNNVHMHDEKYSTFKDTVMTVIDHNMDTSKTWTMGINEYSDMTDAEFFEHFNLKAQAEQKCSATASEPIAYNGAAPSTWDWRDHPQPHGIKVVTGVKNQGHCGSCWTFSTIGAMESHFALSEGKFGNFSEQQLVDCAGDYDNHGCSGGLPSYAFNYIRDWNLTFETLYPYKAVDQKCSYTSSIGRVTTDGPFNITAGNETQMVESLYHAGPVSVAFQVVDGFKNYRSGVYVSDTCGNGPMDVNHAVLAVGYGHNQTSDLDFYTIKNSWGPTWGNNGFFDIERGTNMCGIAVCNSYPTNVRSTDWFKLEELIKY